MKNIVIILMIVITTDVLAQNENPNLSTQNANATGAINKLTVGAYAQIDYNQKIDSDTEQNGVLDVHRLVMTMGYRFSDRTRFVSEIEFEHVNEVFIEQAFVSHKINDYMNIKAGLLLIPMGIINEYHEPPIYNGVERPNVDKNIVPTTWREIGIGINGRIDESAIRYQLYIVNGFNGYSGDTGKFRGKDGLRKGRQKGAKSFMSSPNLSMKVDYYGLSGLKLGLAGYFGKSQSALFNNLDKNDTNGLAAADSSVVGVSMIGLDARYNTGGLSIKGQLITAKISNTTAYNTKTGKDLGSSLLGYYAELGYNVLHNNTNTSSELIPFVRYENYNTHNKVEGITENKTYAKSEVIIGFGWKPTKMTVFKADYQIIKSKADSKSTGQLNLGVGIMF